MKSIYQEMKDLGVQINNHYSDLYVPVTEETTRIVNTHRAKGHRVTKFICNITHTPWYDIPFAFEPYWQKLLDSESATVSFNKT
jgi:hypothetical protein